MSVLVPQAAASSSLSSSPRCPLDSSIEATLPALQSAPGEVQGHVIPEAERGASFRHLLPCGSVQGPGKPAEMEELRALVAHTGRA